MLLSSESSELLLFQEPSGGISILFLRFDILTLVSYRFVSAAATEKEKFRRRSHNCYRHFLALFLVLRTPPRHGAGRLRPRELGPGYSLGY